MPKPKRAAKKKAKRRAKPAPLIGTVPGQLGRVRIEGSKMHITRSPDKVILKKVPKQQKFEKE